MTPPTLRDHFEPCAHPPSRPSRCYRAAIRATPTRECGGSTSSGRGLTVSRSRRFFSYALPFECRAGQLRISRSGIPVPDDVWVQAQTAQGVTMYATFKRLDTGERLTMPLWAHGAGVASASAPARASTWGGIGSFCYASSAGGGWLFLDVDESLPLGAAYNGTEWVQVYAYGQNYRGGYGPWQRSSNTLTYIARPQRCHEQRLHDR